MEDQNAKKCKICHCDALHWCSNCRNVKYCSVKCQKSDWKSHKPNCWPVKIIIDGETKKMVTTREVQENEVILSEVPIAIGPTLFLKKPVHAQIHMQYVKICVNCHTGLPDTCNRCSKCQWPVCDYNCELDPRHVQRECKIFQNYCWDNGTKCNQFIGVARALLLKSTDPVKWDQVLKLKAKELPHEDDVALLQAQIQIILHFRQLFGKHLISLSLKEIRHVMKVWNSVWPSDPFIGGNIFQEELYYTSTFITNDCIPNTKKLIYRAPGKEQCLKYYAKSKLSVGTTVTQTWRFNENTPIGTYYRRTLVHEAGGGWCKCSLCSDPTENYSFVSALKCPNHLIGTNAIDMAYLLPINPLDQESNWKCNACDKDFPIAKILEIVEPIRVQCDSLVSRAKQQKLGITCFERPPMTRSAKTLINKMIKYDEALNSVIHPNHYVKLLLREQILGGLNHLICPISPSESLPMENDDGTNASFGMIVFWREKQRENMEKMHEIVLEILPVLEKIVPDTLAHYRAIYCHAMSRWTYLALALGKNNLNSNSEQVLTEVESITEQLEKKLTGFKDFNFDKLPLTYQVFLLNLKQLRMIKVAIARTDF